MHSPSPSPPLSPSSSASLFEGLSPNEASDHVTHHGFAEAGPLIQNTNCLPAANAHALLVNNYEAPSSPNQFTWGIEPHQPQTTTGLQNKGFPASDHNATGSSLLIDTGTVDQAPFANSPIVNRHKLQNESYGPVLDAVISWPVNNSAIIMPQTMGSQELPNAFTPISGASITAGISVNDPNSWWVNSLYPGRTQAIQPQLFANDFSMMMVQPQLNTNTFPFGYSGPMLPMPAHIQHPLNFCTLCPASFTRPSDYQRHYESVHLGIKHHCFWPGCGNNRGNGYCRAEKLRAHQRRVHGHT